MNRIYTTLAILAVAGSLTAQEKAQSNFSFKAQKDGVDKTIFQVEDIKGFDQKNLVDIWTNDFDNPAEWSAYNDGSPSQDWAIGTAGPTGFYSEPMGTIASTSGGNFALFDSDGWGSGASVQDASLQNATPIDLTAYPNVLLSFESYYRRYVGFTYVEVSADGTTWESIEVHSTQGQNITSDNPEEVVVNVSDVIGGVATAYLRFRYVGGWDYAWMVDDVKLIEQVANDLKVNYSVVSHASGTGLEYGRVPADQITSIDLGVEFMNFGTDAQMNSTANFVMTDPDNTEVVNTNSAPETVEPSDTTYVENTQTDITWIPGIYTTSVEVTSDTEASGSDSFDNNVDTRTMAISNVYSLDGIGVYGANSLASLSTQSFEGGADGFMLFTQYEIIEEQTFFGIEVELNTNGTDAGGTIFAALLTYDDVQADAVAPANWMISSDEYEVTQEDVDAGFINILFDGEIDLAPGSYYAAVQLNSFENGANISILDDTTVPQPGDASLIYIDSDGVYTNGNAMAVRLMSDELGSTVGLNDIESLDLAMTLAPNPASDIARLTFDLERSTDLKIMVLDLTGKSVLDMDQGTLSSGSHLVELDLSELSTGNYQVTILTDQGYSTQQLSVVR